MANQIIVTNTGVVQVVIEPTPNIQVQISRAVIGTVSNVPTANFANFAGNVTNSAQPNITSLGTLTALNVSGNGTVNNLTVTGNLAVGNLVANSANFANFAGEAFNVNASNITGTVANANYAANAGNATIANSANSVTLANVSGAGNIASINLDGNASNILFGNGTFSAIPVVSNVANSNYANFSGTAFSVSGSNVSGEVANAAYANAANTANLATFATTANSVAGANVSGTVANATFALDAGNSNLANTANSVALANVVGIGNIANINLDGNASNILFGNGTFSAIPVVSNVANANYANFAGTAFSVSGSNVSGEVANANYSSYANLASTANLATFATTANSVAGANVSGEVANANYSSYANIAATANSVAVGNVSGIGNIAVINLDGSSSNVLFGNGVFAPESTSIANANYANFAGTVITNAQPNITSLGNLPYLQVSNSANATGVVSQLSSGNITFASNFSNVATYEITTIYHPNNSTAYPGERVIRSRGNVTTPTTAVTGDRINQKAFFAYNGNTNVFAAAETFTLVGTVNANANAAWTGGQWNILTGNPSGDIGNSSALSGQNGLALNNAGGISITPGTAPNTSLGQATSQFFIQGYGSSTTDLASTNTMFFQRARGNRDAVASVQPNDQLGQISWAAYNGTAYTGSKSGSFRIEVDSSYTTGNLIVPIQMTFRTVDTANTSIFTTILANGGFRQHSLAVLQSNANGQLSFGLNAATTSQGNNAIAIGSTSGQITQGANSVAVGYFAGYTGQGSNAIAIGAQAGTTNQANNSIILNASGVGLEQTTANTFTVKPVRNVGTANLMFYDNSSGEITYDLASNATVGNANYANFAGNLINGNSNVTVLANSNVTFNVSGVANTLVVSSTGANIIALNVADTANVTGTIQQLAPNTITIATNATTNTAYNLTTLYGNIVEPGQYSIIRSRGNSSTPATAVVNDVGSRESVYFYNGTTNAVGFSTSVILSNLNSNSNAVTTGASYNLSVGNPNGDQGNSNALSGFNTLSYDRTGTLTLINGAAPTGTGALQQLQLINYGHTSGNTNAAVGGISMRRARGNRDANVTVEPNDQLGRVVFGGYNGNAFQTNRTALVRGVVDNTYVGGNANIPIGLQFLTCDNTTTYTHNFYSNGNVLFSNAILGSSVSVSGNVTGGNISTTGNITGGNISTGGLITATGNITGGNLLTNGNIIGSGGNYNFSNGVSNAVTFNVYGDKTPNSTFDLSDIQFSVNMNNVDTTTGFSPFRFQQYAPTNNQFGAMFMYRARGNSFATQTSVVAGDIILRIVPSINSNNAFASIGEFASRVIYNDNAGNTAGNVNISAVGSGTTGYLNSVINLDANTTNANNLVANNVAINSNGFVKLANYTEAAIGAITGQLGWIAAISDSAGGGNPNGMICFWDTTNNRWSYIHDNSAV